MFVGPGQEMGRRFVAIDNRVTAYTAEILGSLAGIAVFGLLSYFRVPAWTWFLIALAIGIAFVRASALVHAVGGLAVLGVVALADWPGDPLGVPTEVVWSPYYQVRFKPRYLSIDVNNMGHQGMLPVDRSGPAYFLPHLLNRDSGNKPFDDVLIIGAGSGNDVAAALAQRCRSRRCRRDRPGDQRTGQVCIIPTGPTATRGSRSTSTTAAVSSARPPRVMT